MALLMSVYNHLGLTVVQYMWDHVSFEGLSIDVWADISVDCSSIFRLVCQLILARLSTKMSVKSWLSIGQVSTNISVEWFFPVDHVMTNSRSR